MSQSATRVRPSLARVDWNRLVDLAEPSIAQRGRTYFYQGRAKLFIVGDHDAMLHVQGSGPSPYNVDISLKRGESRYLVYANCDCPYAKGTPREICKHKVAAFLALSHHYQNQSRNRWSRLLTMALEQVERPKQVTKSVLVFRLNLNGSYQVITPMLAAAGRIPEEVIDDPDALAGFLESEASKVQFRDVQNRVQPERIANAPLEHIAAMDVLVRNYYTSAWAPTLDLTLPLLTDALLYEGDHRQPLRRRVWVSNEPAKLEVEVQAAEDGIRLVGYLCTREERTRIDPNHVKPVGHDTGWVLIGSRVTKLGTAQPVTSLFLSKPEISVPAEEADEFYEDYLPSLIEHATVSGHGVGGWREVRESPVPRVYLTEEDQELFAELRFGYGDYEAVYDRLLPTETVFRDPTIPALIRLRRDAGAEQKFWKALASYGLKRGLGGDTRYVLRQNVHTIDFLIHQVPRLAADGYEVYGEEEIKSVRVSRCTPKVSLRVSSGIDWFDVKVIVEFGETHVSFAEIRKAVRKRERFVKLADGSMGEIPEEWMARYKHLFDLAEDSDEGLRLTRSQAVLLGQAISEADNATTDAEVRNQLAKLRDLTSIEEKPLPSGFHGEMRHYQKSGYDWLHFLHDYGFGGCLADDMGLGKTIQALAFLRSLRDSGHSGAADLIVMPRSLLTNWAREAERFVPGTRILTYAEVDRPKDTSEFDNCDLVLTTYGVMLRDLDLLRDYRFHYVILDESQAIKNPLAQTARAARSLSADHRLVLTGTPVENSTIELWSQFAFINPGMLGSMDYFKTEFAAAIERRRDDDAARKLRSMVYPFILRRTKQQVAPDLPPIDERVVYCDMEPAQRKLYDRTRDEYRHALMGLIEGRGMNAARMKVLEGLLRLRQISNHPRLVDKSSKVDSVKYEVLLEMLETLRAEGHKALVFSQFVRMLRIIRTGLEARGIPYQYLDGSTNNRQQRVDEFQSNPEVPFFLISLKAGGVGLNLTAADYVIHVDPWWNPAVERQASDRTHRIGQRKPVSVTKLIARDTVEEKMLLLQDRKKDLVDQLITTETSFFKSLTPDDVEALFS